MPQPFDILLVDDDQNMRRSLAEILAEDGYRVQVASTGEEAVDLCQRFLFRLILMDVRMPGIDGVEAFRQIRKHCIRSQIVLMSAYSNPELADEALRAGVLAFLQKPLEVEAVLKLIAEITGTAALYLGTSPDQAETLRSGLAQHGFRLTLATTLDEALGIAAQTHYDVLVLDLDSRPAARHALARLRELLPDLPVIDASATDDPALPDGPNPAAAGAFATLPRPLQVDPLVAVLEQIKRMRLETRLPPNSS